MSSRALGLPAPPESIPITPSDEVWLAMTPAQREAHLLEVFAALEQERMSTGEGLQHSRAKIRALNTLGGHFDRIDRTIFLAADLAVLYPGEEAFCPDLLAVLDVESPEDDRRMCWSVTLERRGVDLVLEVLVAGDRNKDLVRNVARYARLGIPEYFVYDRGTQKLYGYRLQGSTYRNIAPRLGLLHSQILGLNLGVLEDRLRFFSGDAMVPEPMEILGRLEALMARREADLLEREQRLAAEVAAREEAERQREEALVRAEAAEAARAALEQELASLRARLGGQG